MTTLQHEHLGVIEPSSIAPLETAKVALKSLLSPSESLEIESLDSIPLKAVTELEHISDPFKQLARAARLHDILPEQDVVATIDPLIDSSSGELADSLAEEDRRRRLPKEDPEHIEATGSGVYLLPNEVIASFEAQDAHPSPQTKKLVDFAIDHAISNDLRDTFREAKKHADENGIQLMDALSVVRSQPSSFEPSTRDIIDQYDWLYDKKAS